jgi:hypothetical protein
MATMRRGHANLARGSQRCVTCDVAGGIRQHCSMARARSTAGERLAHTPGLMEMSRAVLTQKGSRGLFPCLSKLGTRAAFLFDPRHRAGQ